MRKFARDGFASRDQSLARFLACFKKPTSRLIMPIAPSWMVSWYFLFFLEKHYISQYYLFLICYVCARLCRCFGQGGCYFGCDKPCTCSYTRTQRFLMLRSCAYLNSSVNLAFRPKSGFKNKCRAGAVFGLVISGSGRVQASKWGPFTTLCGYVCRGQQREIERRPPSPTNSTNKLKSFCEVGYTLILGQMFVVLTRGYQWRF